MSTLSSSVNPPLLNLRATEPHRQYSKASVFNEWQMPLDKTVYSFLESEKFCASMAFAWRKSLHFLMATNVLLRVPLETVPKLNGPFQMKKWNANTFRTKTFFEFNIITANVCGHYRPHFDAEQITGASFVSDCTPDSCLGRLEVCCARKLHRNINRLYLIHREVNCANIRRMVSIQEFGGNTISCDSLNPTV